MKIVLLGGGDVLGESAKECFPEPDMETIPCRTYMDALALAHDESGIVSVLISANADEEPLERFIHLFKSAARGCSAIAIMSAPSVELYISLMRKGLDECFTTPIDPDILSRAIKKLAASRRMSHQRRRGQARKRGLESNIPSLRS